MAKFTKEDLENDFVRRCKVFTVPSGKDVKIRNLKQSEYRKFRAGNYHSDGEPNVDRLKFVNELLASWMLVNYDDEKRMLTEEEVMAGAFDQLNAADVESITDQAKVWLGLSDTITSLEDAVKNSEGTLNEESTEE